MFNSPDIFLRKRGAVEGMSDHISQTPNYLFISSRFSPSSNPLLKSSSFHFLINSLASHLERLKQIPVNSPGAQKEKKIR